MPKRSSKHDVDGWVADIVTKTTGANEPEISEKNPAAVALGRLGGLKGGRARAAKLSAERRREIARLAAEARWKKREH